MTSRDCFPLPGELIDAILSLLSPQDLARVTQVNRTMRTYALADRYWVGFTLKHLPERVHRHFPPSESCVPLPPHIPSYHHLYAAHEARWFLARYKIWLCGHDMVGKIVVARYDPRRGCLEGYRLLAVSREGPRRALFYPPAPNTMVHSFHPEVLLHLDRPVLKLEARHPPTNEDAAKADGIPAAETLSSVSSTGPKIVLYQPPAPLSFGQYMQNKAGQKGGDTADADDAGGDTPLPPVCPRIRPIVMDMDGDNVLLSQNNGSNGGSNGGSRRNGRGSPNGDNTGIDNIHIAMANNSSSSSFVTSSQLRRQFVYARPLADKAAKGGGTFTRRGQSAGGDAGDDDDEGDAGDEGAEGAAGAQGGTAAAIDTTVIHGAHNAGGAGATLNMPADDELPIGRPPSASSPLPFPLYTVWPPPAIPSEHRVRGTGISANHYPRGAVGQPRLRSEISDHAFHMRTWMDMGVPLGGSSSSSHSGGSPMTFDALETYATIDPKHYTPTEDKVYRGIWAGDYSSHGVEFLLVHQPDDDDDDEDNGGAGPFDPDAFPQRDDESDADHARRVRSARIHRGRLEGIKLTGDPNVPRGERSFVAPDLGDAGLDLVIDEAPFQGVRVVKSEGHIAGTGFRNDRYVESRLLLISPNRLAQYWVGFGHISFFERVDIDKFVDAIV